MRRTSPLAWLVLGVLGILTAGAVALGLLEAPASAALAVRNAAGETAMASRLAATFSTRVSGASSAIGASNETAAGHFTYTAPDRLTVTGRTFAPGGLSSPATTNHLKGAAAQQALQPLRLVQHINNFHKQGSAYIGSANISSGGRALGTLVATVRVNNGFVVLLDTDYRLMTSAGLATERATYRFHEIGG